MSLLRLSPAVQLGLVLACITFMLSNIEAKAPWEGQKPRDYKVLNMRDLAKHGDCGSLLRAGYNISGVYRVSLNNTDVDMPCEFRDGNAFTVILRRVDPSINFAVGWGYYEHGFGHPSGNYWAGLLNIYHLTNSGGTVKQLQINMQDWSGVNKNMVYTYFRLDERNTRYRLNVHGYHGDLPDDLSFNNLMPFSTNDAPDPHNCAGLGQAGFWYNYCSKYLPTGRYYPHPIYTPPPGYHYDGMYYHDWHGDNYSLKFISWTVVG